MFSNYLAVAVRNIMKNKVFSFINIAGLSIGLSAVMLITLYIWDEITFDSYLGQNNGIYKLEMETNFGGRGVRKNRVTAGAVADGLLTDYPDLVAGSTRVNALTATITVGDRNVSEDAMRADPSFFQLFDIEYVAGSAATAMPDMSSVALSETTANKYFEPGTALGQTLLLDDGKSYRIGAVFKDFPDNTHLRPNMIFPLKPGNYDLVSDDAGWWQMRFFTYVQLKNGVTAADLNAVLPEFIDRHREEIRPGVALSEVYGFNSIALADVHFETAAADAGDPLILTGFAAIAVVILSIATFNFMNMSISRAVGRTKEVAIRKVFGAGKGNVISLFISETLVTVMISLLLALVITELSLLWFNDFVSKLMSMGVFVSPIFIIGMIGLVITVAFGAGFYPAFIMTKIRPATVLSGGRSQSKNMSRLGTALVTIQFAVAIALIITTTIIYQQIRYSQTMDPGYSKENLVLLRGLQHPSVNPSVQILKQRLLAHPNISDVALTDQAPGGTYGWYEGVDNVNGVALEQAISVRGMLVDRDFTQAYGVELVAGRTLSEQRPADVSRGIGEEQPRTTYNIMINETAVRVLGLGTPSEAVGKTLGENDVWTVAGVIGDYLLGSSKGTVPPMMFSIDEQGFRTLALRFKTNDVSKLLADTDAIWSDIAGARPIRRQFMDDRIAALYRTEQQQGQIFALFSGLAVLVSCIGLYGLVSFSVARRQREIGVRKILGATNGIITRQILWDFSKPVLVANVIAWPLTAYLMSDWLTNFNYRIDLGPTPFLAAAIAALFVAGLTVIGHALRVASANPIHALRHE